MCASSLHLLSHGMISAGVCYRQLAPVKGRDICYHPSVDTSLERARSSRRVLVWGHPTRQMRHTHLVRNATWHDAGEPVEVGAHIQRTAVCRDAAADSNAYCAQLACFCSGCVHPHARRAGDAACGVDSMASGNVGHHVLQAFNERTSATAQAAEIDNRVYDQLARSVEGDVSATEGVLDGGSQRLELLQTRTCEVTAQVSVASGSVPEAWRERCVSCTACRRCTRVHADSHTKASACALCSPV